MGIHSMADSPSGKIKGLLEQLESVQNENVKIHEAMVTLEETNRLLKEENDAVKDVNQQLREMIQKRPPYVPALPAPAPTPLVHPHHPHAYAHGGYPHLYHGVHPQLPGAKVERTVKEEGEEGDGEEAAVAPFHPFHPAHGGQYAQGGQGGLYPAGAMYADPYGYHGHGIPSHASYYQEMLQSHAKMEHDRYLESREKIVKQAEEAQEELLKREAALSEKEAQHQQYLVEREALMNKSKNEWRQTVVPYSANQYPFRRTRFAQSRSPFAYEQSLLQKHRLDQHIDKYKDELSQLEQSRSKYDSELSMLEKSRS